MNYITIVSRTDFFPLFTHTLAAHTPLNAFRLQRAIKMLLFIANVSVKRVLSYALLCPK